MYRLYFTICVDHPEKRDSSFYPVAPGAKSAQVWEYKTHASAVGVYEAILRGDWDFASEYVSRAAVYADNGRGGSRTVRREVRRERPVVLRLYSLGPTGHLGWDIRRIAPSATRRAA